MRRGELGASRDQADLANYIERLSTETNYQYVPLRRIGARMPLETHLSDTQHDEVWRRSRRTPGAAWERVADFDRQLNKSSDHPGRCSSPVGSSPAQPWYPQ